MSEDKNSNVKDQNSQQMSMGNLKNFFQRKYPNETEEEIMVRTLDHMKTQFFYTFQSQTSKDDMQSMKTSSSMGSIDSNTFEGLAGEAQNDDPTAEDFWDAMIQSMAQKAKEKAKAKVMTRD